MMNIRKMTLASAILLASTSFAFAQNSAGNTGKPSSKTDCDLSMPRDNMSDKCKAEFDAMQNNQTTGSTTEAPAINNTDEQLDKTEKSKAGNTSGSGGGG